MAAALTVLRTEGVNALSMRRVAVQLGTGAASLYAHVSNKGELLELIFDEVIAEVPLPEPDPARWREQVTQLWLDSRETLARNGDIARVALGRVQCGPNSMRIAELTMTIMRLGGVPDWAVAWAIDVSRLYVAASAIEGAINAERNHGGSELVLYDAELVRYFTTLAVDRFPTTAALAPILTTGDRDERFRFGLDLLVHGLAAQAVGPRPDSVAH